MAPTKAERHKEKFLLEQQGTEELIALESRQESPVTKKSVVFFGSRLFCIFFFLKKNTKKIEGLTHV